MNDDLKYINCTFNWVFAMKPHPVSGKYTMDLCNLSDKVVEFFEQEGVTVKEDDEKGKYVQSSSQYPLKFIRGLEQNDDGTWPLIGNGSTGRVGIALYNTTYKKKTFRKVSVRRMAISNLVPFESGPDPLDDADELSYDEGSEV